jgi:SPP1 gp7 family putative phage head morphogenesis protein
MCIRDRNPDDAPDAEKLFKAAPRALAPVGRSRQKVRQARNRMQRVLQKRFAVLAPRAAQQLAAAFEARTKMDLPRHDVESVLASLDLDWDVMVPEVADLLAALAIDGAVQAAVQLQITDSLPQALDLANERASEYARTRAAEMVGKRWVDGQLQEVASANWQIGQATQDMLRTQVTQAIDEGLSAQQLAQAIEESGAFSAERALMIARTETAMADVQGNVALYQAANQSGVEVYKRWITAGDDRVSEDCQLNGESPPLPMDEEFPSGAQFPPEHPNCRCDIAPVLFTDLVDEAATGF